MHVSPRALRWIFAFVVAASLATGTGLSGCTDQSTEAPASKDTASSTETPPADEVPQESVRIDYADPDTWIARPDTASLPVDVFYLIPTSWSKASESEPNICAIDNASLHSTAPAVIEQTATAYESAGNVYAPYYRQADAAYCLSLSPDDQEKLLSGIPKQDIFAALDYYFEHDNEGRPFILAGHSQGSDMMLFVLSEYFGAHPEYLERMVAAYAIGYSVTEGFLTENPHLSFAEGADDTGVIVSYNTEAPQIEGQNPVVLEGALAINPITWTRTDEPASADLSLGSRIDGVDRPRFADATVDTERGVVVCSTADPDEFSSASPLFGKGVFHGQDYPFYYYDIRANAELRTATYLSQNS